MESLTSSAHFRFRLKQYGMPCLCGCAGFLVLLSIMVGVVYRAFQEITLQSLAQLNSEFSVQTDTLSSHRHQLFKRTDRRIRRPQRG